MWVIWWIASQFSMSREARGSHQPTWPFLLKLREVSTAQGCSTHVWHPQKEKHDDQTMSGPCDQSLYRQRQVQRVKPFFMRSRQTITAGTKQRQMAALQTMMEANCSDLDSIKWCDKHNDNSPAIMLFLMVSSSSLRTRYRPTIPHTRIR